MDAETEEMVQGRQRASIKWLLTKAFNNRVPENLKEPFYSDQENKLRLKPQIIVELGNANLYCQALSHIYSDPNYQNLNHWAILQTLNRKGIPVFESADLSITETVLLQTNPLKINAHMAVIESLMMLYAKEVASGDRIHKVIQRISGRYQAIADQSCEQTLLDWVSHVCAALKESIAKKKEVEVLAENDLQYVPNIPPVQDFRDLCDGVCLALLISYYCPNILSWTEVRTRYLPSVEDSLFNISLVKDFSEKCLPYSIFHMLPEDIIFMRGSMKLNLIVLLVDLFNFFEIHPVKVARNPQTETKATAETLTTHEQAKQPIESKDFESNNNGVDNNKAFVVNKSRGIKTASVINKHNEDQANEMPHATQDKARQASNWDKNRRKSISGRRSRKNSLSEESQLTIENFGGSQEQLNVIGHYDRSNDMQVLSGQYKKTLEQKLAKCASIIEGCDPSQSGNGLKQSAEKLNVDANNHVIKNQNRLGTATEKNMTNLSEKALIEKQLLNDKYLNRFIFHGSKLDVDDTNNKTISLQNPSQYTKSDFSDQFVADVKSLDDAAKLSNIREKLEEKMRLIEQDKYKVELALLRYQRQIEENYMSRDDSKPKLEMDSIELKKYQKNIAAMNINLQEIQQDIQKLTTQQNQLQAQHIQAQQLMQAQHISNMLNQQQQFYGSQQHLEDFQRQFHRQTSFGSSPHILQNYNQSCPPSRDAFHQMQSMQMPYTMDHGQYVSPQQQLVIPSTRYLQGVFCDTRPLSQNILYQPIASEDHSSKPQIQVQIQPKSKIYLSESSSPLPLQHLNWDCSAYGQQQTDLENNSRKSANPILKSEDVTDEPNSLLSCRNSNDSDYANFETKTFNNFYRQNSNPGEKSSSPKNFRRPLEYSGEKLFRDQMMLPQSICFIGDQEDVEDIESNIIESLHGTQFLDNDQRSRAGSSSEEFGSNEIFAREIDVRNSTLTYRVVSPSHLHLNLKTSQCQQNEKANQKGFYISFDDDHPKRPKPLLRVKRSLKNNGLDNNIDAKYVLTSHSNNSASFESENMQLSVDKHATYNKYSDNQLKFHQMSAKEEIPEQKIQQVISSPQINSNSAITKNYGSDVTNKTLVIGADESISNQDSVEEMERRKEKIMLLSLQRRQQQEEAKARKEVQAARARESQREKEENKSRKKEEQLARRAAILEKHRLKKALEEAEKEGKSLDRTDKITRQGSNLSFTPRLRLQKFVRSRPKTIHVDDGSVDVSESSSISNLSKRGSSSNSAGFDHLNSNSNKRDYFRGSQDSLSLKGSPDEYPSTSSTPIGRMGSYKTSREASCDRGRTYSRGFVSKGSILNISSRKANSLNNLSDSGLGRSTPPRRAPSPGMMPSNRHMPSPSGPGSLPPGLVTKRHIYEDGSSDISSIMEYSGPKLYKQPASKSNRMIILNAVEYCVFPGAVNREAKHKVLEKIARSDSKHFLILFRDAGCQFRALYGYTPEAEQVCKLYGTGPSQVDEVMFDKFFKYNSGTKCFSQVHTKHMTVTIDAFTIHNSLWQGKKVQLPSKKDMALVI